MEQWNQVKNASNVAFSGRIETLVNTRTRKLPERAILLIYLEYTAPTLADVFGQTPTELEYGHVECCIKRSARCWSRTASTYLARIGLM